MPTVDIYNIQKEKVGELDLKDEIFGVAVRGDVLHEVVTWQRACRRSGCACTKTRGEVKGGGRKPWRQKGTGRARAGMRNSPIWRGGGIVFGPKPHLYDREMNKQERRQALRGALTLKRREGQITVLERISLEKIKTRALKQLLDRLGLTDALIVVAEPDSKLKLSARNLPGVKVLLCAGINVRDVLNYRHLVLTRAALEQIQEALA